MALPSQRVESSQEVGRSFAVRQAAPSRVPMLIAGVVLAGSAIAAIWYFASLPGKNNPGTNAPIGGVAPGGKNATLMKDSGKPASGPPIVKLGGQSPGPTGGTGTPADPGPASTGTGTPPASTPGVTPRGTDTGKPAGVDLTNPTGKPTPGTPEASPGNSPATPPLPPTGSTGEITSLIAEGDRKLKANDLVGARASFSKAYVNAKTVRSDLDSLRSKLETINKDLFASAKVYPGDPMTEEYVVADGDGLQRIARRRNLVTDWRLIERTNKVDSTKLRVGQKLKLIRGPFHAVVHKSDFRVDLFWGAPKDPEAWIFVRSFRVGLGPNTPVGEFAVKPAGKMVNPPWTNPQNPAEKYGADDPKNPIGEFWIGIQGEGDAAKHKGFGLHGTIDPGSIGQDKSMGCVRLLPDDIAQVYELLMDPVGVVRIVP